MNNPDDREDKRIESGTRTIGEPMNIFRYWIRFMSGRCPDCNHELTAWSADRDICLNCGYDTRYR
jgi:hypothetical protein